MKLNSSTKGFSLAELITVVVIIGFLIAIVIGAYTNVSSAALEKSKQANCAEMNKLVLAIYQAGGGYAITSTNSASLITSLKTGYTVPGTNILIALPPQANPNPAAYKITTLSGTPTGLPAFMVEIDTSAPSERP